MERITQKMLDRLCERLNRMTDSPLTPYTKTNGEFTANIGNFHMDYAYGGSKIIRMVKGGGIREVTCGFCTKRETWDAGQGVITGIQLAGEGA